jgi:photosystem I subunit 3
VVRAPPCHGGSCGFESRQSRKVYKHLLIFLLLAIFLYLFLENLVSMKKKFNKTLKPLFTLFLFPFILNSFLGNDIAQANDNISNLIECKNSANLEKRLTSSIKKFENRLKLYDENTPQAEFLKKEISLTNARFESYKKSNLLCGKDGLPHLITNGDFHHFNEFSLPALVFLYITGWIGWAGRKYLQYSLNTENSFENEIIINVPIAFPIIISGFLWPIEAWKEFIAGKLIVTDDEVTISPR